MSDSAQHVIARCRQIACFSESMTGITRTFLCPAMHKVHTFLREWMQRVGMDARIDAMGNLRGIYEGVGAENERRLLIGSHLDSVPDAGAYDGVVGVVLAIALVEALGGKRLPFAIEIVGFSEEEGVRFGVPFLGSRALMGRVDRELLETPDQQGVSIAEAIRRFGLNPDEMDSALIAPGTFAYLEFHIEQGPVLEDLGQPVGVVRAIAGQSRYAVTFTGKASHAGTTPMHLRRDALAGAAEWISAVETEARGVEGLVATVGAIESEPRAGNVVPGCVRATLDVRHGSDEVRTSAMDRLLGAAREIASRRSLRFNAQQFLEQCAVAMDPELVAVAGRAAATAGCDAPCLESGAGHDAMIVAEKVPAAMIFLRSPGGISHHPDESVREDDVECALATGLHFLDELSNLKSGSQ